MRPEDNFWKVYWPANGKWQRVRRGRLANVTVTVKATTHRLRTGQCGSHSLQLNTASQRKGQARITADKQTPEFSEIRLTLSALQWAFEQLDQSSRKWSLRACHITWYNCDRLSMGRYQKQTHTMLSWIYNHKVLAPGESQQASEGPPSKGRWQPPKPEKHLFPWLSALPVTWAKQKAPLPRATPTHWGIPTHMSP